MAPNKRPCQVLRISDLPDDPLLNILSNLEVRDSVAARRLSRRWRDVWDSKPPSRLEFNWESMFLTEENKKWYWEVSKNPCSDYRDRFVEAIDQFLKFYKGTNVELFSIRFCLGGEQSSDINRWIDIAVNKLGTKCLKLELACDKPCAERHIKSVYELDFGAILCEGSTVEHATLGGITIRFISRDIYYLSMLETYIINLTELRLCHCWVPATLFLDSLKHLVKLWVEDCWTLGELKLDNQKMTTLVCFGPLPVTFNAGGVPNLLDLRCVVDEPEFNSVLSTIGRELQNLTEMRILYIKWRKTKERIGSIEASATVTSISLVLRDKRKFDISKLLTVLFAFPNLKQLKLQLLCRFDVQQEDAIPARHDALQHLEEVEISGFHGTPKQIEFVALLLRCAKSLRTLIIYRTLLCWDYLLYDKPFSLSNEETRASWANREFESISSQLSSVDRKDVTVLIQKDTDLQRLM